jgi:LmbE family N-acetylglucosaminyl deacetylase
MSEHVAEGTNQIAALLAADPPDQVFIPYSGEPPADHRAVWEMARGALTRLGRPVQVFEYPVWFWDAYPWMADGTGRGWSAWPERMFAFPGRLARLFRDFRAAVAIGSVREGKREALACHATQMERQGDHEGWATLGWISSGEFLDCFFQEFELFHRYQFSPAADG